MADITYKDNELNLVVDNTIEVCVKEPEGTASVSKKEYKLIGDDQAYFPSTYEDAPAWLQVLVDSTTKAATDVAKGDFDTANQSLLDAIAIANIAANTYTNSIISSDDIDQRILTAINTLNSSLQAADANILDIAQTATTPDEATALAGTVLTTSLGSTDTGTIGASISDLSTVVSQGDQANATSIDTLVSTLDGINTDVEANATATQTLRTTVGIDSAGTPTGSGILNSITDLQSQIDGNITTWFRTGAPTLAHLPASDWTTTELRNNHLGDIYYDNDTGYGYRFAFEDIDDSPDLGQIYSWIRITDTDVVTALANAAAAQETADSKIVTFFQATEPTADGVGDLWFDSANDNKLFRWDGTSWVDGADSRVFANAQAITAINAYVKDPVSGLVGGAQSQLIQEVDTKVEDGELRSQAKFAYNSLIDISGVKYKSGFGLDSGTTTSGTGTQGDPFISDFWIDASRFAFTNSNATGKVYPFIIDATGTTPRATFNGVVDFTNTNEASGYPGTVSINGGLIEADSILADRINTTGLIAENIYATEIIGKTIEGAVINGAQINGAVIKASFLDLDGELEVLTNYYLVTGTDLSDVPATAVFENRYLTNYVFAAGDDSVAIENTNLYRIPSISTVREANINKNITSDPLIGVIHAYDSYQAGNNIKAVKRTPTLGVTADTEIFNYTFSVTPAFNNSLVNTDGYSTTSVDFSLFGQTKTLSWNLATINGSSSGDDSGASNSTLRSGQVVFGGATIFNNLSGSNDRAHDDAPFISTPGNAAVNVELGGVPIDINLQVNVAGTNFAQSLSFKLTFTIPSGSHESTSAFTNAELIKIVSNSSSAVRTLNSYNAKTSTSLFINNII